MLRHLALRRKTFTPGLSNAVAPPAAAIAFDAAGTAPAPPRLTTGVTVGRRFDGDRRTDIAMDDFSGGRVSVLLNATPAGGSIAFAPEALFPAAELPLAIATADLNGDGKDDIVTANVGIAQLGTTFTVFMSTTAAGSSQAAFVPTSIRSGAPVAVTLGDVDGDGRADIVLGQQLDPVDPSTGGAVSVYANRTPTGARRPALEPPVDAASGYIAYSAALTDFDADGSADMASSDRYFSSKMDFRFQTPSSSARIVDATATGKIERTPRGGIGMTDPAL